MIAPVGMRSLLRNVQFALLEQVRYFQVSK